MKPVVLTLAMLLPTTSIIVWWLRRPEMAENIERIMGEWISCEWWGVGWAEVGERALVSGRVVPADFGDGGEVRILCHSP